jgi:DNA repair protein RadC
VAEAPEQPHHLGHRERLRRRFLDGGADAVPDYELMELLLFAARPRGDVKPLAKALIQRFGSFAGAINAEIPALLAVPEMGESSVATLKAVQAAVQRVLRSEMRERPILGSGQAVLDYCRARLGHESVEEFHVLFLDRKNGLIADERQSRGTVDHTPVYVREVMKRALELAASSLLLVHNHPSGDTTPSRADIEMTRDLAKAAATLGIALHDHLVVGRAGHTSLRAAGLM